MLNPRIDRTTPVIIQGITGRAGQMHSRLMQQYGTNIVGGVSPKKESNDINKIPVFSDCAAAVTATGAQASVLLVGAFDLLRAMEDAVAAGVRYPVSPAQ